MKARMFRAEPEEVAVVGCDFAPAAPVAFGVNLLEKGMDALRPQRRRAPKLHSAALRRNAVNKVSGLPTSAASAHIAHSQSGRVV